MHIKGCSWTNLPAGPPPWWLKLDLIAHRLTVHKLPKEMPRALRFLVCSCCLKTRTQKKSQNSMINRSLAANDNMNGMSIKVWWIKLQCRPDTVLQNFLDNVADDPRDECKLQISKVVCGHIMGLYSNVGDWHLVVATDPPHFFCCLLAQLSDVTFWIDGARISPAPWCKDQGNSSTHRHHKILETENSKHLKTCWLVALLNRFKQHKSHFATTTFVQSFCLMVIAEALVNACKVLVQQDIRSDPIQQELIQKVVHKGSVTELGM